MKFLIATLALIIGLQADAMAQHRRSSHHRKVQRHHSRHHGRTFYRTHSAHSAEAPSPYHGDNTPINDGQKKNKHRNMNYNTGQPVPSNNGK